MSELVNNIIEIHDQHDLDEDTDSLPEDEDQDTANVLGDEHEHTDSTGAERAIVLSAKTSEKDDDDFRPAKKRKAQEGSEGMEVDEVVKMKINTRNYYV